MSVERYFSTHLQCGVYTQDTSASLISKTQCNCTDTSAYSPETSGYLRTHKKGTHCK